MERRKKERSVKRNIRTIPENYLIIRISSIILVLAILDLNFINVWSLNLLILLVCLVIYGIFIFYPRKGTNKILDIVKFALGVVCIFSGISLLMFVFKSTVMHDFPLNVGIIISLYALCWVIAGWYLVVKSQYTKINSRFINKF